MNRLLYVSYGQGLHEQEILFSAWTALHHAGASPDFEILIYTDHPESFAELPATTIHPVSTAQWTEWSGPQGFNHRRKIQALRDALATYQGKIVFLDGDTWLRTSPSALFDRVADGQTVMHLREGDVGGIDSAMHRELTAMLEQSDFSNLQSQPYNLTAATGMWNSGVVGIAAADAGILDDVLHLTDQLADRITSHVLEQFAFGVVLDKRTRLRETGDLVFHYWPPYLHVPFKKQIATVMEQSRKLPVEHRAAFLYGHRPRPTLSRRCRVILKRCAQMVGLVRGGCRSSEW